MAMPTRYSIFLNESLRKQKNFLPSFSSLKAEDKCGAISAASFSVGCYRNRFRGLKINYFSRWWLGILSLQMKVLVYIQFGKMYFIFVHLGWVGLNTQTKIVNEFPQFSSFQ